MTLATANTDGPEWMLYDTDLSTPLHILKGIDAGLYLRLNEPGSGSMTLPLTDPAAADIQHARFVVCSYRGAIRGGFFIESIERIDVNESEYTGRAVRFSGRGSLALLDDACVADWGTPDVQNTRKFGTDGIDLTGMVPAYPINSGAPWTKGNIFASLLREARDLITNTLGQKTDRYCWHVDGASFGVDAGTEILDWDFDETNDSIPVPWTVAEDIELRVGMSLLDVLRQIAALQHDFTIDFDPATGFMLHGFDQRIGTDKSGTVFFRVGQNCIGVSYTSTCTDVRNQITVELSDPITPFTEVYNNPSLQAYRRRESFLSASNATTVATAEDYGTEELKAIKDPVTEVSVKISDAVGPRIFIDYELGDKISYDDIGTVEELRVVGAELSWPGDQKYADVVVEVEDMEVTP